MLGGIRDFATIEKFYHICSPNEYVDLLVTPVWADPPRLVCVPLVCSSDPSLTQSTSLATSERTHTTSADLT